MGYIYALDFPDGKSYIGLTTKTPEHRYLTHKRATKFSQLLVHRAWRKHGDPKMRVLAQVEDEDLAFYEIRAIKVYETLSPKGYNLAFGGEISPMKNPEVSQKVAQKLRGKRGTFTGLKHSDSAKEKQRISKVGRLLTEDHKRKISAAGVGRVPTEETRAKISAANKGKPKSEAHKAKLAAALTLPPMETQEPELIGYGSNGKRLYSVCKQGHPLFGDNLRITQEGKYTKRRCVECGRLRQQASMKKKRGE